MLIKYFMEDERKEKIKYGSVRELAVSMAVYTSGSIFGPLIVFGAIGYFFDKYFGTKPLFIIISVGIAFVATNVFLVKKIKHLMKEMDSRADSGADKEDNSLADKKKAI